ncbi:hypothetical protein GQ55_4G129800 [Panicum hallii var. hallii]|uniref:F-box associated domain-containing protein n=1 Tax=Panicum hallii var. hallii TaxID=1504633 RepID=A0A2T7DY11_9POAL|nr:hypothetical protein GQ55_4G129800 [Panicum hallii var. hallii]
MSCQKLSRQSLHLVLNEGRGLYSLRHMDVSRLFYTSTAQALEAEAKAKKKNGIHRLGGIGCLPRPSIYYQPFSSAVSNPNSLVNVFALFGESKNKILYSDVEGHTNIYNTEFRSFMTMPSLNSPKGPNCMAAHITRTPAHARSDFDINPEVDYGFFAEKPCGEHTDSLYMMDMGQDKPGCFEVLAYYPVGEWQWRALPSPPFFDDLEYKACNNIAYAIVDGTRICVSSATATYSFDTVTLEWSKTGDWVLPFHTKAEYVPELDLWLGLSASSPSDLCALDLSTAAIDSCDVPPMQHVGLDVDLPKDWLLKSRTLVNLGSDAQDGPQVVAFTGVDVVPCGDNQQGERTLRRIKHKSKCLVTDRIEYVL